MIVETVDETEQHGGTGDEVSPAALLRLSTRVHKKALKEYIDLATRIKAKRAELRAMKRDLRMLKREVEWTERRENDMEQDPPPER